MMSIDLRGILDKQKIPYTEAGRVLFPNAKSPYLAINRILTGESLLDSDQVSLLCQMTGLSVSEVFSTGSWEAKSEGAKMTFTNGVYSAELCTESWITKVYENGKKFHEVLIHSEGVALSKYLKMINSIIENKNS